ncbi:MAG: flagellin, partial [Terracidiphilus sp.]
RYIAAQAAIQGIKKELPSMALGVLNNLSAIYAENNLNNTNNSLQTVLEQLSSGSRINSGADDAAGLSLVNGLGANSAALTQSETNATEGVGLLQVADGALSQVTSLLNRAITLATEASNGTLNSTQESAANQEYQSILAEVNNIGSTTTYNQEQVFGSNTDIYTGDSSSAGSSLDNLNIRGLSEASVGDTGGVMSYSSSQTTGNVFVDLTQNPSAGTATALSSDYLTGGETGSSTISVDTLNSSGGVETTTIPVGAGTTYANTAEGMIKAINNAGLGLTASFTTAAIAGDSSAAAQTDTGIMITGSVGSGSSPSAASYKGTLTASNVADGNDLTGSITFKVGDGAAQTVNMSAVNSAEGGVTVADLGDYIEADTGLGVTVVDTGGTLTFSSAAGSTDALTVTSNLTDSTLGAAMTYTSTAAYFDGISASTAEDSGIGGTANAQTAASAVDTGTATTSTGTATISYSDEAGLSLSGTDLLNQSDAESALNDLNTAISDVAAQDGYIGAQINTLNSISQVMSTQQENVVSAQNAIQATDYASATSNMSEYEILSQTGIAALAQANSVEQEVTKLLQ